VSGRSRTLRRVARLAVPAGLCALLLGVATPPAPSGASGSSIAPSPGSASVVAAMVGSASRLSTLPVTSFPPLSLEGVDSVSHVSPTTARGCLTTTACVFGDLHARRTIVLFGDSHAQMWLPAVAAAGRTLRYRVVLLFLGGCPFASVTVWNPQPLGPFPAGYYGYCDGFRRNALRAIERLRPALVLLSNRTSLIESSPNHYFDRAQWVHGVKTTVRDLRRSVRDVAVIGDVVYLQRPMPECLAAYPTDVQACATANPNLAAHSHEAAEREAARAAGASFINVLPWVCTARCSPVIGPFLVYLNQAHLDVAYVTFLSKVMTSAIRRVLR
jgi:SGNH domain (fused to AT3 domains)